MSHETCTKCLKQKSSHGGSLTQWISVCNCDLNGDLFGPSDDAAPLPRCNACKKPVRQRHAGSLTQWIFHEDTCNCDKPIVDQPTRKNEYRQTGFRGFDDTGEIELELDGQKFPTKRYKPIGVLGSGASGTVYLGRDRVLEKLVAVKVLRVLDRDTLLSFQNEARTTSKLSHSNIIKILDFGSTDGGVPFMVMEYLQGVSLEVLIQDNGGLDIDTAVSLFIEIADALHHAHELNILHRDLKPSNILVVENRDTFEAHLIDFGIAKLKQQQGSTINSGTTMVGTPAYMSPDHAKGQADRRADIYSLGCVMFETLTGRQVFSAENAISMLSLHANNKPPSLLEFLPDSREIRLLNDIIEKCLAKDPDLRYKTAEALKLTLLAVPIGPGANDNIRQSYARVRSSLPFVDYKESKKSRRNKHQIWLTAGSALILMLVTVSFTLWRFFFDNSNQAAMNMPMSVLPFTKAAESPGAMDEVDHSRINPKERFNTTIETGATDEQMIETVRNSNIIIKSIQIVATKATPSGLRKLHELPKLRRLAFRNQHFTVDHFRALAEFPKVTSVGFRDQIDLSGLSELSRSKIAELELRNLRVSKKILQDLGKIKTLNYIEFTDCTGFEDIRISELAALPNLVYLDLSGSDVTDATLKRVYQLARLKKLYLNHTQVTAAVLNSVEASSSIGYLQMSSCPKVDYEVVRKFHLTHDIEVSFSNPLDTPVSER